MATVVRPRIMTPSTVGLSAVEEVGHPEVLAAVRVGNGGDDQRPGRHEQLRD